MLGSRGRRQRRLWRGHVCRGLVHARGVRWPAAPPNKGNYWQYREWVRGLACGWVIGRWAGLTTGAGGWDGPNRGPGGCRGRPLRTAPLLQAMATPTRNAERHRLAEDAGRAAEGGRGASNRRARRVVRKRRGATRTHAPSPRSSSTFPHLQVFPSFRPVF